MKEGKKSLARSIYEMVSGQAKTSRKGGKQMATRIQRAVVAVALALLMATVLAGVAWAATLVGGNGSDVLCKGVIVLDAP
jgi:hypothetical protein